jgi:1,4-alpha-glucan branching enzyme
MSQSRALDLRRRLPVGAELTDSGVHFRVWAPARRRVHVVIEPPAVNTAASAGRWG